MPIGSFEQHGPHLPPDTDYLIAEKIAKNTASRFNGKVVEGIKIGISVEHEGFKNTKSLSPIEFSIRIESIISSFPKDFKLFLINAHGGNNDALVSIQKQFGEKILVLNTFRLIKDALKEIRTSEIGGICHAGEFETSLMLYLYPKLVEMNKLKKTDIAYIPNIDPNYGEGKLQIWKTKKFSKSGILGDPFHATSKKGELWFNFLTEKIKSLIENFMLKN